MNKLNILLSLKDSKKSNNILKNLKTQTNQNKTFCFNWVKNKKKIRTNKDKENHKSLKKLYKNKLKKYRDIIKLNKLTEEIQNNLTKNYNELFKEEVTLNNNITDLKENYEKYKDELSNLKLDRTNLFKKLKKVKKIDKLLNYINGFKNINLKDEIEKITKFCESNFNCESEDIINDVELREKILIKEIDNFLSLYY